MKVRTGFVSNSSSSSFVLAGFLFDREDYDLESLMKIFGYEINENLISENIKKYNSTREEEIRNQLYEFRDHLSGKGLYLGLDYEDGVPDGYECMIGTLLMDTEYNDCCDTQILDSSSMSKELQEIKDKLGIKEDLKYIIGTRCC